MRQIGDRTIEPEVNAGDWGVLEGGRGQAQGGQALEGQGANVVIGYVVLAAGQDAFRGDALDRAAQPQRDVAGGVPQLRAVQLAQRDGGHAHLVPIGAGEETQPEDLKAVARGHAVHILVNGADQHLAPEALDGAGRLPLFAQPVEHGDAIEIVAPGTLAPQRQQSAGDGDLVAGR